MGICDRFPEIISMKHCPTCRTSKLRDHFYRDNRTPDGLKGQCKACHIEGCIRTRNKDRKRSANAQYMRRAFLKDPEKFRKQWRRASRQRVWTFKHEARYQLNRAIRRGDIARPEQCEACKSKGRITAHHDNYSMPLRVRWLCYPCHGREHRND